MSSTRQEGVVAPFLDVNRDGHHAPIDILLVVNALNRSSNSAEGEILPPGDDLFGLWATAPVTLPAPSSLRQNVFPPASPVYTRRFYLATQSLGGAGLPTQIKDAPPTALGRSGTFGEPGLEDVYDIDTIDDLMAGPLHCFLPDWLQVPA